MLVMNHKTNLKFWKVKELGLWGSPWSSDCLWYLAGAVLTEPMVAGGGLRYESLIESWFFSGISEWALKEGDIQLTQQFLSGLWCIYTDQLPWASTSPREIRSVHWRPWMTMILLPDSQKDETKLRALWEKERILSLEGKGISKMAVLVPFLSLWWNAWQKAI